MNSSPVRARRLPSARYISLRSDVQISQDNDSLLTSPCGRYSSVSASAGTGPVRTKRPRTSRNGNRLILTICVVAVIARRITIAHAFSRLDLDHHIIRSRQLRHPLKDKRSSLAATSSSMGSSDIQASAKESEAALPPRRNWRICTRSIVEAATNPTRPDGAATTSPFEQTASGDGDNPQDSVAALETSTWSPEAYQSALELYDRLMEYCSAHGDSDDCDDNLPQLILSSLDILHQAYRLYGPESVVGSYNGGKDACVILHLMRAAYANFIRDNPALVGSARQPKTIYFEHEDEFLEVLDLLHETVVEYDLAMLAFEKGIKYPDGLRSIVETNFVGVNKTNAAVSTWTDTRRPFPIAFVLGTRAGDPNAGGQKAFAPSSSFMPPFMRVNPILSPEWTYSSVWEFLRRFDLKYCKLYDEGYTSLGTVKDTVPCPALKKDDLDLSWEEDTGNSLHGGECNGEYWPAYMLKDWDQERAGRIKKEK